MTEDDNLTPYFAARERFLRGPLRDRELSFKQVRQAGWQLANNPNDLHMFGLPPMLWYLLGCRITGRTAVEMTRDLPASFISKSVAATLSPFGSISDVIDPFVGSGNLIFHVGRDLGASRIVGLDANATVLNRTRRNFARQRLMGRLGGLDSTLELRDWKTVPQDIKDRRTLFIVAPPWGEAFTSSGLDLRRTTPSVSAILETLSNAVGPGKSFALVQTHPLMVTASVDQIRKSYRVFPSEKSSNPMISERVDYMLLELRGRV